MTVVKPSVGMSANWNHDWFITVYEKTGCSVVREKYIYCLFCIDACKITVLKRQD
jgi:polyferredoxin